ncbi:MAG: RuvC family protein [Vulcanimicrobiaceae bacterium]
MSECILGIDPGTRKTGLAVLALEDGSILERCIAATHEIDEVIARLRSTWGITVVAMGSGTNSALLRELPALAGADIRMVDEHETSLQARELYFSEHPPAGWRRLIPLGLQTPPVPVDDYAAVLIARRLL